MAKKDINYSEMAAFFRQQKKNFRFCEHGEEMANAIVDQENVLAALRVEEKSLKPNIERDTAVLEELSIKISGARKEIEVCNTVIAGKVAKTKEELSYYEAEVTGKKKALDGVKAEAQQYDNLVQSQKKELDTVSNAFNKKQKDCVSIEAKTDRAKVKLKEVKDSLVGEF